RPRSAPRTSPERRAQRANGQRPGRYLVRRRLPGRPSVPLRPCTFSLMIAGAMNSLGHFISQAGCETPGCADLCTDCKSIESRPNRNDHFGLCRNDYSNPSLNTSSTRGTTSFEGAEAELSPTELVATTVNV